QIVRFGPSVCCTTGGLVSLPIVIAARVARVPVYIWEGNAVPGRVNRLLAGWSQRIGTTFDASLRALPRARTTVSGNPIRGSLLRWDRASGRSKLGIGEGETVVFVTGGSQGSAAINGAVSGALTRLLRRATVIHHAGTAHERQAQAKRDALPEELRPRYRVYRFLREEMGAALASADLVIGRASSSSIAEPLARGDTVSGSDRGTWPLAESLAEAGARVFRSFDARNVAGADVVIRSSAYGDTNVEVAAARATGLAVWKREDAWSELATGKRVVAVAGTPGKSTTKELVCTAL